MHVDYLIVGQGLAGSLLAFELSRREKTFVIIDENTSVSSSKVAPGMFTPISGKRMTKSPQTDDQLAAAYTMFSEIEKALQIQLLHKMNIYSVFGSVKEQNDLMLKRENSNFFQHINLNPIIEEHLHQPYGAIEINGSGWIDIGLLLIEFRSTLNKKNIFIEEKFEYDDLEIHESTVIYRDIRADFIIFCEGWKALDNPYFPSLPFNLCKGDILLIECNDLDENRILKKGIYLLPIGNHLFKVGSTYRWNEINDMKDESGKLFLTERLNELVNIPYRIIEHYTGMRPTTITREPFFKQHHRYHPLMILNGLGTKGAVNGPWMIRNVIKEIINKS